MIKILHNRAAELLTAGYRKGYGAAAIAGAGGREERRVLAPPLTQTPCLIDDADYP